MAARSSEPSASRISGPNSATSRSRPTVPCSTTSRAIESASTTTAPRAASIREASDLPDPIPPVSPTITPMPSLPCPHPAISPPPDAQCDVGWLLNGVSRRERHTVRARRPGLWTRRAAQPATRPGLLDVLRHFAQAGLGCPRGASGAIPAAPALLARAGSGRTTRRTGRSRIAGSAGLPRMSRRARGSPRPPCSSRPPGPSEGGPPRTCAACRGTRGREPTGPPCQCPWSCRLRRRSARKRVSWSAARLSIPLRSMLSMACV